MKAFNTTKVSVSVRTFQRNATGFSNHVP